MRFRKTRAEDDGVLVVDKSAEHRCRPPGSYEWPVGQWKVDRPDLYPDGTVWRCGCGKAWESSSRFTRLWLQWERAYAHDTGPVRGKTT